MIFIDLKKNYNRVLRMVLLKALKNNRVYIICILAIKNMYDQLATDMRTKAGIT